MANKQIAWEGKEIYPAVVILTVLLVLSILVLTGALTWGARGWRNYRQEKAINNQLMGVPNVPVPVDEPMPEEVLG